MERDKLRSEQSQTELANTTAKNPSPQKVDAFIDPACVQNIRQLLRLIHFSQKLAKQPKKLYQKVHHILTNYLNVIHLSVISYIEHDTKGHILYQKSEDLKLTKPINNIIKQYLSDTRLQPSQQLALLSNQLSVLYGEETTWLLKGGNAEATRWLLLSVPKKQLAMAELLMSLLGSQLAVVTSRQQYNTLLDCHNLVHQKLESMKQIGRIHTLALATMALEDLSGKELFLAVANLLFKQYQHSDIHLIGIEATTVNTVLSTSNNKVNFNITTIKRLQQQGPAVVALHLLGEIREVNKAVAPDTFSAIAIPLKQLKHSQSHPAILLVESHSEELKFTTDDLSIFEYAAMVLSGDMERQQTNFFKEKLQDIELRVYKKNSSYQQIHQKLEQHLLDKHLQEHQLFRSILHDPLTNLANRILMIDRLEQALIHQKRHGDQFALMFIDLDHFKPINDQLGHNVGDEVLKQAAENISLSIRANDLASRWGGDEFVVLLDSIRGKKEVELIISRIKLAFSKPFIHKTNPIILSCSIGINIFDPGTYSNANSIIKDTDQAMYRAKQQQGLSFCYFNGSSIAEQRLSNQLRQQLSFAMEHGEIIPHYQPMIRLIDHQLLGFEVVARWKHGRQPLQSACDFIPMAEKIGLIADLDLIILQQALQQLRLWNQSNKAKGNIRISVNLSGHHLSNPSSMLRLTNSINLRPINRSQLVFEFSEREVVQHNGQALKAMEQLHEQGILIGLDGFGTGFSSLNALFEYPVDYIKIDQSYTHKMLNSNRDLALIRAIRDMSNDLGFKVIIEGIETEKQHNKLIEIGCEFGQGYYIAHPMRHQSISKILT